MINTTEPLISIIVPIFNAEKYLEQCVSSILAQTYTNIELILVNNASVDKSQEICEFFKAKDKRIRIINLKVNVLASGARNLGTGHAKGEWLIFIDADDYWDDSSGLERLVNYASHVRYHVDFIIFNYKRYFQKINKYVNRPDYSSALIGCDEKYEKIELLLKNSFIPAPSWGKLIRLNFLNENNIAFKEGIHAEDILWFISLLESCKNFALTNIRFHVYRKQVPGAGTYGFNTKRYDDLFYILKHESQRLKNNKTNRINHLLLSFLAYVLTILFATSANFKGKEYWKRQKELAAYMWLFKYDLTKKVKIAKIMYRYMPKKVASEILHLYAKRYVNRV